MTAGGLSVHGRLRNAGLAPPPYPRPCAIIGPRSPAAADIWQMQSPDSPCGINKSPQRGAGHTRTRARTHTDAPATGGRRNSLSLAPTAAEAGCSLSTMRSGNKLVWTPKSPFSDSAFVYCSTSIHVRLWTRRPCETPPVRISCCAKREIVCCLRFRTLFSGFYFSSSHLFDFPPAGV